MNPPPWKVYSHDVWGVRELVAICWDWNNMWKFIDDFRERTGRPTSVYLGKVYNSQFYDKGEEHD